MKTKIYSFTYEECLVMRDAMVEYYQSIKNLKPNSPIAIRSIKLAEVLKEQFKDEVNLWKE